MSPKNGNVIKYTQKENEKNWIDSLTYSSWEIDDSAILIPYT